MSLLKANKPITAPDVRFQRKTVTRYNGVSAVRVAQAVFDPSANTGDRTIGAHGLGVYIPAKAIIVDAWVDIITTFADGVTNAATIALHVQTAGDLTAAIAISDASAVWNAGLRGTKVNNYALDGLALTQVAMAAARAATHIKVTAEREVTATVAGVALTAGKAVIYVAYMLGD